MNIKSYLTNLKPSSTLVINEQSKEMERHGKEVIKFGFGQSPFPVPGNITEELKKHAFQKDYLPVKGLLPLRKAIHADLIKKSLHHYSVDNIFVGPGTKQLMFLLQLAFDGDIILPAPSWVSYDPQALIAKNKVHWVQTKIENNWHVTPQDIEEVLKTCSTKNKLIVLNTPNNPSGTNAHNLQELAKKFKEHEIIVLSDEIYSDLTFKGSYHSIASFYPERTIISNGLSKWCGAGGWRLGYFAIPDLLKDLDDKMQVIASEAYSSASAPIQYAAVVAYNSDQKEFLDNSKKILQTISDYCFKKLNTNSISVKEPEGGFYIMPDFTEMLKHKFNSSSQMCSQLLLDTGVAVLPGSDFGFPESQLLFRLSFVDFDGAKFLQYAKDKPSLTEQDIQQYAPKVINGIEKILDWAAKMSA